MKRLASGIIAVFILLTSLYAQTTAVQPKKIVVDDNSVVKDSSGIVLPAFVWKTLLQTFDYTLKPVDINTNPQQFVLVAYTPAEKAARLARMSPPPESRFFVTGKTIGNSRMTDMEGQSYNLKELKGKIVVMNFWFINCPPCRNEIPHLNEVVKKYESNKDVVFLAVALDEKYDLKKFLANTPFQYHIIDNGRYVVANYGVNSFPTHVILDREGKVNFHTTGLAPNTVSWIDKSIDALLARQ